MLLAGRNTLESCLSVCAQKLTNRGDLAMNSLEVVLQGAVSTHLADVGLVLFGNLEPPLQRFCLDGKVWAAPNCKGRKQQFKTGSTPSVK